MEFINNFYQSAPLFVNILLFIGGLAFLIKGSDFFVDSAVFFARKFKVSEVVIGLTLVSIGTSLPELATNISSALKGRTAIAIGNITGSNITNIALILGIAALFMGKIKFNKKLFYRDSFFMLFASGLLLVFAYFFDKSVYQINRVESIIMVCLIIVYIIYLVKFNKESIAEEHHNDGWIKSIFVGIIIFILGFIGIYIGSEVMVGNIIVIAGRLNIADGVIGATVVALGTSFPELAVTIVSIVKKKHDLSLGNIIGSNIFNILCILGITGLIKDISIISPDGAIDTMMLFFTLPMTLFIAILLVIMMRIKWQLGRIKGGIFILTYIFFIILNYTGIPFIKNFG